MYKDSNGAKLARTFHSLTFESHTQSRVNLTLDCVDEDAIVSQLADSGGLIVEPHQIIAVTIRTVNVKRLRRVPDNAGR